MKCRPQKCGPEHVRGEESRRAAASSGGCVGDTDEYGNGFHSGGLCGLAAGATRDT